MLAITGASNNIIEIDGDICAQFPLLDKAQGDLLVFSDNTILCVQYTSEGVWRITRPTRGSAEVTIRRAVRGERSDVAVLDGDISWVDHPSRMVRRGD